MEWACQYAKFRVQDCRIKGSGFAAFGVDGFRVCRIGPVPRIRLFLQRAGGVEGRDLNRNISDHR